jgi:hypothetical protein
VRQRQLRNVHEDERECDAVPLADKIKEADRLVELVEPDYQVLSETRLRTIEGDTAMGSTLAAAFGPDGLSVT